MLTLKESKFVNIIENAAEKKGKTFFNYIIKCMCTNVRLRSYQVCLELYRDGYNFS